MCQKIAVKSPKTQYLLFYATRWRTAWNCHRARDEEREVNTENCTLNSEFPGEQYYKYSVVLRITSPLPTAHILHFTNLSLAAGLLLGFFSIEVEPIIKFKTICISGLLPIRLDVFICQKNVVHYLLLHLCECCSWITRDQYAHQLCHLGYKWSDVLTCIPIPSFNNK